MYSGKIKKANGSEALIAVKTLKPGSKESAKTKFLEEAFTMSQFKHPKIVAMIGVVTRGSIEFLATDLSLIFRISIKSGLFFLKRMTDHLRAKI